MNDGNQDNASANRRRFVRSHFGKTVSTFHRGQFGTERALDISEGGLLLLAKREYAKDEILEISLEVTGQRLHAVIVQVCYVFKVENHTYVGVQFMDMSPHLPLLVREIKEYVAESVASAGAAPRTE